METVSHSPLTIPLAVDDANLNSQGFPEVLIFAEAEWVEDNSVHACGETNVVEADSASGGEPKGVVFFLKNNRPGVVSTIIGAGVATVALKDDLPYTTRLEEYWWNARTNPSYGDVCANGYVYAYGHFVGTLYLHLTRAPLDQATSVDAYEQ